MKAGELPAAVPSMPPPAGVAPVAGPDALPGTLDAGCYRVAANRSTALHACERRSDDLADDDGREDYDPEPTVDDGGSAAEGTTTTLLAAAPANA